MAKLVKNPIPEFEVSGLPHGSMNSNPMVFGIIKSRSAANAQRAAKVLGIMKGMVVMSVRPITQVFLAPEQQDVNRRFANHIGWHQSDSNLDPNEGKQ